MPATPDAITVDLLYLDLSQCGRCNGARAALDQAIAATEPALEAMGMSIETNAIHVTSLAQAQAENFIASPTIRVNGRDIQPEAHQSSCAECGDLCACDGGIDCRVWAWQGERHLAPPVPLIVQAILAAASGPIDGQAAGVDPGVAAEGQQNLARFFSDESAGAEACCAPGCCGKP